MDLVKFELKAQARDIFRFNWIHFMDWFKYYKSKIIFIHWNIRNKILNEIWAILILFEIERIWESYSEAQFLIFVWLKYN